MFKSFSFLCSTTLSRVMASQSSTQFLVEATQRSWLTFRKKFPVKSSKNINKNTSTISRLISRVKKTLPKPLSTFLGPKLLTTKSYVRNSAKRLPWWRDLSLNTSQRYWFSHWRGSSLMWKTWYEKNSMITSNSLKNSTWLNFHSENSSRTNPLKSE